MCSEWWQNVQWVVTKCAVSGDKMCSEWTFWHILSPCSYKTCQGDQTGSQCITLVTWWQNMPWWQNEPQQGHPCAVRFKLVKLCCSSYSELQQGQPPCSLPISCKTKSTLKHIASYKRLGNCYDPLLKTQYWADCSLDYDYWSYMATLRLVA